MLDKKAMMLEANQTASLRLAEQDDCGVSSREWGENLQEMVALAYFDLSEGPLVGQEFFISNFPFSNPSIHHQIHVAPYHLFKANGINK